MLAALTAALSLTPAASGATQAAPGAVAPVKPEIKPEAQREVKPQSAPTFAEHVAPIIHRHCAACHRPGQVGPFNLLSFADVAKRAEMVGTVVRDRYMPPWKPVIGHGEFANERRLSDAELATIDAWVLAGAPEGDPAKTPALPAFPEGQWPLGKPDLVLKMEQAYPVPAQGRDEYRWFVLPLALPEDKWVKAVDFRPSSRAVVHHALFFLDDTGHARKLDGADGKPGFGGMRSRISGRLGGYVPGATPAPFPVDLALHLPRQSDFLLQVHFHPSGKAAQEQSEVALYFADKPPSRKLLPLQLPPAFGRGAGIDVPPGEANYRIEESFTLPADATAWNVSGHAHYICREMRLTATLPDGTRKRLLYIDDWDLDWQDRYDFREPIRLPKGTVIKSEIVWDNSPTNPNNPFSPPRRIRWGRESTDEMGSITLMLTADRVADEPILQRAYLKHMATVVRGAAADATERLIENAMDRLDANRDGKLQRSEAPARLNSKLFDRLDTNRNGELDEKELQPLEDLLERARGS